MHYHNFVFLTTNIAKDIFKIVLVLQLILQFCISDIDILYRKDVCDENEFYIPYVRLLKTRQPHHEHSPILKLLKPGYLDVSRHTGVLCINGPAIVYTSINRDTKCTNDSALQWVPSFGEPQIFNHDCFAFNRLTRDEYKKPGQTVIKKESEVFGNKVFGVYLLGTSPDYRMSNFVFFPQSDFGHRPDSAWCIHDGASIAFLANSSDSSTYCYSVKNYNMEGIVAVSYGGNPAFCYREDQNIDFDTPWHKDIPLRADDIVWEKCGSNMIPQIPADYEPEPLQMPDFRIVDPKFWSSQGSSGVRWQAKRKSVDSYDVPVFSKPNPPGSLFPGEPGWKDPSEMIHPHISGSDFRSLDDEDEETTTGEPVQKFHIEIPASDCEEVPKVPDKCGEDLGSGECQILLNILTIEETDWKSPELKDGSWRVPILNLINSIYVKACPQVTKFLAPALSRVFQYFLDKAVKADATLGTKFKNPRNIDWADLLNDLEHCNDKAEMMKFFRKKDLPALKLKKKLEGKLVKLQKSITARITAHESEGNGVLNEVLSPSSFHTSPNHTADVIEMEKIQHHLNEFSLKFPYKILIGNAKNPGYSEASKVYRYREAAEIDYELDWALDAYWKVISTVLGYCNIHYASRDSSTFMRLYESFTQDFLDYVNKEWTKPENRRIYELLFGEFIFGSGVLWIDACHDGAYQWSETTDLRPLRPLALSEGAPSITASSLTNFFVDNPAYTKLNEENYDNQESTESQETVSQSNKNLTNEI